ncbi:MAG: DUF3368 domain-containing protein, partial [Gammaproteobacteria bacterium]|nr:DUF3368 domain-containing protein [Gammaproteobacteria bacterium]
MAILVSDANIFVDITVANLTTAVFQLEDTIATPDVLYEEELQAHHPELPGLGLRIEQLPSEGVAEVERLHANYTGPSSNDLFALALAKTNEWTLLTGDRSLRQAAEEEAIEVHGTLWLVERMVNTQVMNVAQADTAFNLIKEKDCRLPLG